MFFKSIGIDLGTHRCLYMSAVRDSPYGASVVARDRATGRILKVGSEAQEDVAERGDIIAIRPCATALSPTTDYRKDAYIFYKKSHGRPFSVRRGGVRSVEDNEVEERAVRDAARYAGARTVELSRSRCGGDRRGS